MPGLELKGGGITVPLYLGAVAPVELQGGGVPVFLYLGALPPVAPLVSGLDSYTVGDLTGYSIEQLETGDPIPLYIGGGMVPLYVGTPFPLGLIEMLTNYTILGLDSYTIADLDTL